MGEMGKGVGVPKKYKTNLSFGMEAHAHEADVAGIFLAPHTLLSLRDGCLVHLAMLLVTGRRLDSAGALLCAVVRAIGTLQGGKHVLYCTGKPGRDSIEDAGEGLSLVSEAPKAPCRGICPSVHEYEIHLGPSPIET